MLDSLQLHLSLEYIAVFINLLNLLKLFDLHPVLVVLLHPEPLTHLFLLLPLDSLLHPLFIVDLSLERACSFLGKCDSSVLLGPLLHILLPHVLIVPVLDELTHLELSLHVGAHDLLLVLPLAVSHHLLLLVYPVLVVGHVVVFFLRVLVDVAGVLLYDLGVDTIRGVLSLLLISHVLVEFVLIALFLHLIYHLLELKRPLRL